MSDLNVIYKIAADISGLKSGVDRAAKATEGLQSMAATVGKALTAAFTVAAVVKLGKDVLDFAGNLEDLSAQTGLSTTALQKFDLAFSQAGVSMEAVAGASAKLANNLISGDKSTVGALTALGLSVKELKTLAPEDQFLKVADAIGSIQNPTERTYAAMQVFGKGGAELLKGLNGNLAETVAQFEKMGLVVDEKTIKQIDDFGDSMGVLGKQIIAVGANAIGPLMPMLGKFMEALIQIAKVVGEQLALGFKLFMTAALGLGTTIELLIADLLAAVAKIPGASKVFGDLSGTIAALRADAQEGRAAIVEMWTATDQAGESAKKATPPLIGLGEGTEEAAKAAKKAAAAYRDFNNWIVMREFEDAAEQMRRLAEATKLAAENQALYTTWLYNSATPLQTQNDLLLQMERNMAAVGAAATKEGGGMIWGAPAIGTLEPFKGGRSKIAAELGQVFSGDNIGKLVTQGLTGGGGLSGAMQAVGSQAGLSLTKGLGESITKNIGGKLGSMLGGLVGPLGALAGPLIDKLGGFFKNLFGGKEKETNKIREEFVQMHGGLDKLNQKAAAAGVSLTAMLKTKTPEAYKKAIDDINAALETQATRTADIAEHGGLDKLSDKAKIAGTNLTAMLDAKTPEAYKKAIDELNGALAFQDEAMATLDKTVEKYGFTIQELGPVFAKQQLHKRAEELYKDFQVLAAAGVPVENIVKKMGKSINEFVNDAKKTGTEVPEAMKPMLQAMIDNGELVDENGEKYEDLESTGLTFSKTMTQGFNELIKTVEKLTSAIARGLGLAIDDLPDQKNIGINVHTTHTSSGQPTTPGAPGSPGGGPTSPGGGDGPGSGGPLHPTRLTPSAFVSPDAQIAAGARQPSPAGMLPFADAAPRVNVDLTLNIDGVFNEGDLVSTIQRRVVPIIHDTWNANVAGTRTQARDVLGVA